MIVEVGGVFFSIPCDGTTRTLSCLLLYLRRSSDVLQELRTVAGTERAKVTSLLQ